MYASDRVKSSVTRNVEWFPHSKKFTVLLLKMMVVIFIVQAEFHKRKFLHNGSILLNYFQIDLDLLKMTHIFELHETILPKENS